MSEDTGIQIPSPETGERVVIQFKDTSKVKMVDGELTTSTRSRGLKWRGDQ